MNKLRDKLDTLLTVTVATAPLVLFSMGCLSDDPRRFFNNLLAIPFMVIMAALPVAVLGLIFGMLRK